MAQEEAATEMVADTMLCGGDSAAVDSMLLHLLQWKKSLHLLLSLWKPAKC